MSFMKTLNVLKGRWHNDLHVLKLQAPPKAKCKRQLSTDSDIQLSVNVSETSQPFMEEVCLNSRHLLDISKDRVKSGSKRECIQLQEVARCQHKLPFTTSSVNFSPKKFKSDMEYLTSPARGRVVLMSPKRSTFEQNIHDAVLTQKLENVYPESHFTSDHLVSPKLFQTNSVSPKTRIQQTSKEANNAFTHLDTNVHNNYRGDDEYFTPKMGHSKIKMTNEKGNVSNSQQSELQCSKNKCTSKRHNCEPDIFVFPDSESESLINFDISNRVHADHTDDEPDGLDSPMDMDVCSSEEQYRNQRQGNHVYQTFGYQQFSSPVICKQLKRSHSSQNPMNELCRSDVHRNSSLLNSSLNCQVEAQGTAFHKRSAFEQSFNSSQFNSSHFRSSSYLSSESSIKQRENISHDSRSASRQMSEHCTFSLPSLSQADGQSSKTVFSNSIKVNRSDRGQFKKDDHCSASLCEQIISKNMLDDMPSSRWDKEILDCSESDDVSRYLEEDMNLANNIFAENKMVSNTALLSVSNCSHTNMIQNDRLRRRPDDGIFDDCQVQTIADTNVCYISLNESDSSLSADDMEYLYDDNNNETAKYSDNVAHVYQDFWDETDGRSRKQNHKHRTVNKAIANLFESVVSDDRRTYTSGDHHVPTKNSTINTFCNRGSSGQNMLSLSGNESLSNNSLVLEKEQHCWSLFDSSNQADHHSYEIKLHSDGIVKNLYLPDAKINKESFIATHSNGQSPACSKKKPSWMHMDIQSTRHDQNYTRTLQNVGSLNDEKFIHKEYFADEVDGLGDEEKKRTKSLTIVSQKQGSNETIKSENIVSCFSESEHTERVQRSAPEQGPDSTQLDAHSGFHDTILTSDSIETKCQETHMMTEVNMLQNEMLERQSQMLQLTNQHADDRKLYVDEVKGKRCQQQLLQKREMFYKTTPVCNASSHVLGVNTERSVFSHSPNVRIFRRNSDTAVVDATEICLTRSQSSPSKLGLDEDRLDMRENTFHRPWQDQPKRKLQFSSHPQKTVQTGISDTFLRRMTHPTNMDLPYPSNVQLSQYYEKSSKSVSANITHHRFSGSKEDSRESEENMKTPNKQSAGAFCGSDTSFQQQSFRVTEGHNKPKLQCCACDLCTQPQTSQYTYADRGHTSRGHDASRAVHEDTSSNFAEEVNPSNSSSQHQQHGAHARRDDEVDIRVQVLNIFDETILLRQRLDRIYQENETSCECSRIEQNILSVALDMFRTLGNEVCSRENWLQELQKTKNMISSALDLADNCRRLCRHGRQVTNILPGSVIIRIKCCTLTSVTDLIDLHASADLHIILLNIIRHHVTFDKVGLTLKVTLDPNSVETCKRYLLAQLHDRRVETMVRYSNVLVNSQDNSQVCAVSQGVVGQDHCDSSSKFNISPRRTIGMSITQRERKLSFGEINRTAFQELNISDVCIPSSPSYIRVSRDETLQILAKSDLTFTSPRQPNSPNILTSQRQLNSPNILNSQRQLNSPNILTSPKLQISPGSSPLTSPRKLKICDIISEQENIGQDNE